MSIGAAKMFVLTRHSFSTGMEKMIRAEEIVELQVAMMAAQVYEVGLFKPIGPEHENADSRLGCSRNRQIDSVAQAAK
jgi:hypothetical protein